MHLAVKETNSTLITFLVVFFFSHCYKFEHFNYVNLTSDITILLDENPIEKKQHSRRTVRNHVLKVFAIPLLMVKTTSCV